MIYEPREDSFLLKKYVERYARGKVLDIGTGSGILAEAALKKTKNVLALDIDEDCVNFCRNKGINAIKSDLFENVNGKFDLIIFNLPYLPEDKKEDAEIRRQVCGGKRGNEILERFLREVKDYLEEKGKILIVVSSLTPEVEELISEYGFRYKILEKKKLFFEELKVYLLKYNF